MNRMKRMTIGLLGAGLLLGVTAARAEEKAAGDVNLAPEFEKIADQLLVGPDGKKRKVSQWPGMQLTAEYVRQIGEGKIEGRYTAVKHAVGMAWIQEIVFGRKPWYPPKKVDEAVKRQTEEQQAEKFRRLFIEDAERAALDADPKYVEAEKNVDAARNRLIALGLDEQGAPTDKSKAVAGEKKAEAEAAAKAYAEAAARLSAVEKEVLDKPELVELRKKPAKDLSLREYGWHCTWGSYGGLGAALGIERRNWKHKVWRFGNPSGSGQLHYQYDGMGSGRVYCREGDQLDASWMPRIKTKEPTAAAPAGGPPQVKEGGEKPGTVTTVDLGGGVKLELAWIPPGEFTMGSPTNEVGRCFDETPHRVQLTKGFWMGKYEVTQEQWQRVMGSNPSYFTNAGPKAPVEMVKWDRCRVFMRKLDGMIAAQQAAGGVAGTFRLPTEAEWEWACRAGTDTALYSGKMTIKGTCNSPELDAVAWYAGNSGVKYEGGVDATDSVNFPDKQYEHSAAGTHPVGGKKPNAWGLYDMLGNVWECCQDKYSVYQLGNVTDPMRNGEFGANSTIEGEMAAAGVIRGGSWATIARYCRSAARWEVGYKSISRNPTFGFRLVMDKPAAPEKK